MCFLLISAPDNSPLSSLSCVGAADRSAHILEKVINICLIKNVLFHLSGPIHY